MKKKKLQVEVGKTKKVQYILKIVISVSMLLLFSFNLIDQIIKNQNVLERAYLTIPFLFLGIIHIRLKDEVYFSIVFYVCAIYSATDFSLETDFSVILFALAFSLNKTNRFAIVVVITSIITAITRSYILNMTIPQFSSQLLAYESVMFLSYIILFFPKKNQLIDTMKITNEERDILKLHSIGYTYEEINEVLKLNITNDTIRRKIKKVKDQLGCINDVEFGKKLHESV